MFTLTSHNREIGSSRGRVHLGHHKHHSCPLRLPISPSLTSTPSFCCKTICNTLKPLKANHQTISLSSRIRTQRNHRFLSLSPPLLIRVAPSTNEACLFIRVEDAIAISSHSHLLRLLQSRSSSPELKLERVRMIPCLKSPSGLATQTTHIRVG
jgi:hypothetical protein